MQSKIIEFLASFEDREYHEINSFVKENFSNLSVGDVKQMLQRLSDKKRIEFNPNKSFNRWGLHTKIPEINTEQNTMADYDNWSAMARLTWEELEKIEEDRKALAQQSDFKNLQAALQPITNPPIVQNTEAPKQDQKTSGGKLITRRIVEIIVMVIGGLIVAYLIFKFGWNK